MAREADSNEFSLSVEEKEGPKLISEVSVGISVFFISCSGAHSPAHFSRTRFVLVLSCCLLLPPAAGYGSAGAWHVAGALQPCFQLGRQLARAARTNLYDALAMRS